MSFFPAVKKQYLQEYVYMTSAAFISQPCTHRSLAKGPHMAQGLPSSLREAVRTYHYSALIVKCRLLIARHTGLERIQCIWNFQGTDKGNMFPLYPQRTENAKYEGSK